MKPAISFFFLLMLTQYGHAAGKEWSNDMGRFSYMPDPIQPDTSPVKSTRLIVPGKSIGLTAIEQKMSSVIRRLGNPASGDASMGGHSMSVWYSKPVIHGTDTLINETDIYFYTQHFGEPNPIVRVDHIRVTSSYFMTASRIGVGSALEAVQKNFPGLTKSGTETSPKTNRPVDTYSDDHLGISFEIEEGKCVAVTVYRKTE
ncbi:MAG: hypothetical protein U0U70_09195 [Chitinophagaceae bacterium]